ncbi:Hypothetical protein CINCED_3A021679 [Cinara cedri]|uniref:Uncharacterized protein n=1 Tax=Cinara cedri TaxID=506608 RepID=A0A5E4NB40_9HEMI|nr:Hypothetical protein CINCED_3A021679 [Cinara cedri]
MRCTSFEGPNGVFAVELGSGHELVRSLFRLMYVRSFRPMWSIVCGLWAIVVSAVPVVARLAEYVLEAAVVATRSGDPPRRRNVRAAYARLARCLAVAALLAWLYVRFMVVPVLCTAFEYVAIAVHVVRCL